MKLLQRLLPNTLFGRVFSLYFVSLVIFVGVGLGLFYRYQFSQNIEDELLAAELIMNVAAQSVADSVVIGDYDTITKTLGRSIARSHFFQAKFIDGKGGVLTANNPVPVSVTPPTWLRAMVQDRLFDVNHNIVVGGKDYGVMRLSFNVEAIAAEVWQIALVAFALALGALVGGGLLIRIPLKRWLGNFDRVRVHEAEVLSGAIEVSALLDNDAPVEIRHTFNILSRATGRLSAQREEATVTLNAITDGVTTTDAQNCVTYCNPAALHLLGIRSEAALGVDILQLLPDVFHESGALDDWKERRLALTNPLGHTYILDTTLSTLHSVTHEVVGHVLTFRDVTQQHKLDQQLRAELNVRQRALESLRQLLDTFEPGSHDATPLPADDLDAMSAWLVKLMNERELGHRALDNQKFALDQHAIVSITDLQGAITYVNDRFCDISGYTRDELLGANHRLISSGSLAREFFTRLWQTISGGQVWHGEFCNRNKNGNLYWVDATIVPLYGADGRPQQYIAIRTDITERKNFEAQLAEQLQFVEVLLEATPTAIYLKDLDGRYIRFNKAFADLFGIERADWIGKNVFDLLPEDAAALICEKDAELLESRQTQSYEASFANRLTGEVRDGLYWRAPLTNAKGEVTGLVGTILDITEKNRFEQALRDARQVAEAASQAKSDFLANMSHEIRTPMNGVIGMTDLALDTPLSPSQREYLTIVKSSAQSLLVILNDILDFSKIEAGKLDIESVEFSVVESVSETLKTILARAEAKGLILRADLAPGLPAKVLGDPGRIRQILTNLCDNAIKFTAEGGVTVNVMSRTLGNKGLELHLSVRDTGIGIPPEKQQSVFEAFSQADTSTTRNFGGTGLGLTICARLVELMGGRIWVESEPGRGSTFHFTVRVENLAAVPGPIQVLHVNHPAAGKSAQESSESMRPFTILLVEDHPVNQILATTLLKKWGHTVVLATNGQEAVDLFPTATWDVVLMDMQMPVMGGTEATRIIRAAEPAGQRTPIVAMTANAMEADRQACLDAGMDDHLTKPFKASVLQALLQRVMAKADLPHAG